MGCTVSFEACCGFKARLRERQRVVAALFATTAPYSTVTLFARLRGWSASFPMKTAV